MRPEIADFFVKIRTPAAVVDAAVGIPWTFIATQAGHESRWGKSKLAVEANNLFGFTGDAWVRDNNGQPVVWMPTQEESTLPPEKIKYWTFPDDIIDKTPRAGGGTILNIRRPFRKYDSWEESIRDWASLIVRVFPYAYDGARAGDFAAFVDGLSLGTPDRAGKPRKYATDSKYAAKLKDLYHALEGIA